VIFCLTSEALEYLDCGRKMSLNRRAVFKLLIVAVLALLFGLAGSLPAAAQQKERIWRIGFLSLTKTDSFHAAFLEGMRSLGYVEGRNLIIESRLEAGNNERLSKFAAQLVNLGVDVIVARGTQATAAAKKATSTIPIVMTGSSDPVGTGLVASLSRPGGNVTGMSIQAPDLAQKRLEMLKRVAPKTTRVGVLWNPTNAGNVKEWQQTKLAAKALRIELLSREVRSTKDIATAFKVLNSQETDAIITLTDAILSSDRAEIVDLAIKNRLPGIFHLRDFVENGGLMSYGPDLHTSFRRAAYYVDRILKGTNPADVPVEQPIKFELVINLKTANQFGLTMPTDVLALADKIIK
jgi:putative ABC transport system substrate-binding protein